MDANDNKIFAQLNYIANRHQLRQIVLDIDDYRWIVQKDRHDTGVRGHNFCPGDLVMLYNVKEAKKKLRPAYRGPFKITAFGGDHDKSFRLRQLDGILIRSNFHGDQLKPFRVREGYLVSKAEENHPVYLNIHAGKTIIKIPKRKKKT